MEVSMARLVGKTAPSVQATAVVGNKIVENFSLESLKGKYVVLFFYPLDFTFVCPTELHAFQERLGDFHELGAEVVGCSVDSHFSHLAWLQTPRNKGGIEGVNYPILSDLKKEISEAFDVLAEDAGVSFRGLFLMDKEGVVRHQLINDLPLGRSVEEALRMVKALKFHEEHGEVCPANWNEGERSMSATQEGLEQYFAEEPATV